MKLLRYGKIGQEKPAILDAEGRIRDLSGVVADFAGEALGREILESNQSPRFAVSPRG